MPAIFLDGPVNNDGVLYGVYGVDGGAAGMGGDDTIVGGDIDIRGENFP